MAKPRDNSVASVGEFPLIDRLRRIVPTAGPGVMLGIGDDAAALDLTGPVLATCDIQVEGVHFTWTLCSPSDVGWRAIAVNLSDIAATGGTPRFVLVSLALPATTPVGTVEDLYRGIAEMTARHTVVVVGGNVSSTSGPMVIDVTALGEAGRVLSRSGARPGDRVWISGTVGKSAAGRFLAQHPAAAVPGRESLMMAYRRPTPRVELGRALARVAAVTAMIDTSDGTASDLLHLVEASSVGVRVDATQLPLSSGLAEAAREARTDPLTWALSGGEDYELLFTAGRGFGEGAPGLADRFSVPLTCIGEILPEAQGRSIFDGAASRPLAAEGWDHFKSGGE